MGVFARALRVRLLGGVMAMPIFTYESMSREELIRECKNKQAVINDLNERLDLPPSERIESNGWRKPTSNEPLWDEEVLVYRAGVMRVALLTSDGWRDADHLEEILEPTWWRRLPEKPK